MWQTPITEISVLDTSIELSSDRAKGCIVKVPVSNQVACDHISCC